MSANTVWLDAADPREWRGFAEPRAGEERFRAALGQVSLGVAYLGIDGRWLRVNRRLCDIFGYGEEEFYGLTLPDIAHPADGQLDMQEMWERLAKGERTCCLRPRCVRKDGTVIWVNLTLGLLHPVEGSPERFVCVMRNITERRRKRNRWLRRTPRLDGSVGASSDVGGAEADAMEPPDLSGGYFAAILLRLAPPAPREAVSKPAPPKPPSRLSRPPGRPPAPPGRLSWPP